MHYAEARIFRLGAFHYEIISESDKKRVEMHIPEGAELSPQSLDNSLKIKDRFSKSIFRSGRIYLWNVTRGCCRRR